MSAGPQLNPQVLRCGGKRHGPQWSRLNLRHPAPQLILISQGRYHSQLDDRLGTTVEAGDLLFVPPHSAHSIRCTAEGQSCRLRYLICEPHVDLDWRACLPVEPAKVCSTDLDTDHLEHTFAAICDCYFGTHPYRTQLLGHLASHIWLQCCALWQQQHTDKGRTAPLRRYLRSHMAEPFDRTAFARRFSLSPAYVSQIFKRECGCGPVAYLRQIRVRHAIDLLRDGDLSIGAISKRCGYEDQHYFARIFRQETGRSPSDIRSINDI